jgi:hypothetical protein
LALTDLRDGAFQRCAPRRVVVATLGGLGSEFDGE